MCPDAEEPALFRREGRRFVPSSYATGPWRPDAMHGGAPSALIGAVGVAAVEVNELTARVQIDLERPVPMEPLTVTWDRREVSRRVAHVDVELCTDTGDRVASGRLLAMRTEPVDLADQPFPEQEDPGQFPTVDWDSIYRPGPPSFVRDAVEHRVVRGGYGVPEESVAWLRPLVTVLAGEDDHPLAQLLAVADFGSALGTSGALGGGLALINADVNVTLCRTPLGPWFRLASTGRVGRGGVGLAVTQLADAEGPFGIVTQSQIVRRYGVPGQS